MTPLQKLAALGHEKANRILAEKVMGWELDWRGKYQTSDFCNASYSAENLNTYISEWSPCTDLNHAKLIVDKLDSEDLEEVYDRLLWMSNHNEVLNVFNAPADARMASVFEALKLWPAEESK